jgi:hypothetical protein
MLNVKGFYFGFEDSFDVRDLQYLFVSFEDCTIHNFPDRLHLCFYELSQIFLQSRCRRPASPTNLQNGRLPGFGLIQQEQVMQGRYLCFVQKHVVAHLADVAFEIGEADLVWVHKIC